MHSICGTTKKANASAMAPIAPNQMYGKIKKYQKFTYIQKYQKFMKIYWEFFGAPALEILGVSLI